MGRPRTRPNCQEKDCTQTTKRGRYCPQHRPICQSTNCTKRSRHEREFCYIHQTKTRFHVKLVKTKMTIQVAYMGMSDAPLPPIPPHVDTLRLYGFNQNLFKQFVIPQHIRYIYFEGWHGKLPDCLQSSKIQTLTLVYTNLKAIEPDDLPPTMVHLFINKAENVCNDIRVNPNVTVFTGGST